VRSERGIINNNNNNNNNNNLPSMAKNTVLLNAANSSCLMEAAGVKKIYFVTTDQLANAYDFFLHKAIFISRG
jgi:hypothetical protein